MTNGEAPKNPAENRLDQNTDPSLYRVADILAERQAALIKEIAFVQAAGEQLLQDRNNYRQTFERIQQLYVELNGRHEAALARIEWLRLQLERVAQAFADTQPQAVISIVNEALRTFVEINPDDDTGSSGTGELGEEFGG